MHDEMSRCSRLRKGIRLGIGTHGEMSVCLKVLHEIKGKVRVARKNVRIFTL